ncbi:N5-carboxyaminoimidazole ribonucleotide synthase domain protein [Mycobacterium xenopi 3993]|nr:N5-carboxyaminoimidazole ribonucleotide synthase domain protein [Mycobacterium xenopi 3993]
MIGVPGTPIAAPLVAMVGGGQLARMTHQAAIALGQTLRVLAAAPTIPLRRSPRTWSSAPTPTSTTCAGWPRARTF